MLPKQSAALSSAIQQATSQIRGKSGEQRIACHTYKTIISEDSLYQSLSSLCLTPYRKELKNTYLEIYQKFERSGTRTRTSWKRNNTLKMFQNN